MEVFITVGFLMAVMALCLTWFCCDNFNLKITALATLTIAFAILGRITRATIATRVDSLVSCREMCDQLARMGSLISAANYAFATLALALLVNEALFRFIPTLNRVRAK